VEDDESDLLLDKRYRIIRLLGEGGMGSVHLAEHVGLNKRVAVKFLHLELAGQEDVVKRFDQEARVAASIRHKNIIEVYDVGLSADGDPFLVMEYLEGESLGSLMKRTGPMDLGAACAVMEPVLLALAAANRQEIIHRDLKPDNIFLVHQPDEPPVVKIIDFGLSKITTSSPDMSCTQTGSILGTPAYMSPEQARGVSKIDHRSDLYSVGTILFEMLTGALPYSGQNFTEFFAKLLTEEPRSPREVFPAFPVEAEPILRKALRKNPDERFQSAVEMLEALKTLSGFDKRGERLAFLSSSMGKSTFAAGDLGVNEPAAARVGSRAYAASVAARRESKAQSRAFEQERTEIPRHSNRLLVVGAVVAAVLVLCGVFVLGRKGRSPDPAPIPPAKALTEPATHPAARAVEPIEAPVKAPTLPNPVRPQAADERAVDRAEATPSPSANPDTVPATHGKKASAGGKRLRRGGRGTEMSEQFE
jgi:serine/threonine-protein kinase